MAETRAESLPTVHVLPFLGSRTYLHGTTMFDTVRNYVPPAASLSFKISRRIDSDTVRVEVLRDDGEGSSNYHASLVWRKDGVRGGVRIVPLSPSPQIARVAYDENLVTRQSTLSPREVCYSGPSPFSFVATLIPLFKLLLKQECQIERPGLWMFTRLDLDRDPVDFLPLALKMEQMMGSTFARCRILIAGHPVGALYYSWVFPSA